MNSVPGLVFSLVKGCTRANPNPNPNGRLNWDTIKQKIKEIQNKIDPNQN